MKVVIAADDFKAGYLPLLSTQLTAAGMEFEVVPVTKPWAWKKKVEAWIRGIGDHTGKVALVDAYDVLFFGTPEELDAKITSPLIFAGDRVCWPQEQLKPSYPPCHLPWRFVNAGGVAGDGPTVKRFLTFVASLMKLTIPAHRMDCEQNYFTDQYLHGVGGIDIQCNIFHCMLKDPPGTLAPAMGRWMNTVTGTLPVFIHGQGRSYEDRADIFPMRSKDFRIWGW